MSDIDRLVARLAKLRNNMAPDSLEVRTALTRIGTVLQSQMRINIGRYMAIDSGRLLNSIKYEVEQSGKTAFLRVGSYGIPYAARNEFGGPMTQKEVIKMLIELRLRHANQSDKLNRVTRKGKGVVTVNKDLTGYWRPRPFIRDALKQHKGFIIDTLRALPRDK